MDCLFCRIVSGDVPASIVYESETVVGFKDVHPQAPVHVLIVPKGHIPSFLDLSTEDGVLWGDIRRAVQEVARQFSVEKSGFRLVINNGADPGQSVDHLHVHFLAGRSLGWPPG